MGNPRRLVLRYLALSSLVVTQICKSLFCMFGCLYIYRYLLVASGPQRSLQLRFPSLVAGREGVVRGAVAPRVCPFGEVCEGRRDLSTWARFESASFPLAKRFSSGRTPRVWRVPGRDPRPLTATWLCFSRAGSVGARSSEPAEPGFCFAPAGRHAGGDKNTELGFGSP